MLDIFQKEEGVEEVVAKDNLGTRVFASNVYPFKLKMAYLDESKPNPATGNQGGAHNLNLIFVTEDGNKRELRHQEYVTSGKAKGQKYYYEKDGKKIPLPGFVSANDLCVMLTGKGIMEQDFEVKKVNVWDGTLQKEVPADRKVLVDLVGESIIAGVVKVLENKHNDASQIVEKNEIDKWFDAESHLTTAEKEANKTEAKFIHDWKKRWKDKEKNKVKKADAKAGAPKSSGAGGSLFT